MDRRFVRESLMYVEQIKNDDLVGKSNQSFAMLIKGVILALLAIADAIVGLERHIK